MAVEDLWGVGVGQDGAEPGTEFGEFGRDGGDVGFEPGRVHGVPNLGGGLDLQSPAEKG